MRLAVGRDETSEFRNRMEFNRTRGDAFDLIPRLEFPSLCEGYELVERPTKNLATPPDHCNVQPLTHLSILLCAPIFYEVHPGEPTRATSRQ